MRDRHEPLRFRRNPEPPLAHLGRIARQIDREREAAALHVEPLLRRTPAEQWPGLAEHPELQTCGALERLGNLASDELARNPKYAEAVAQLAVSLAEALPEHNYPAAICAQVRSMAWKDLGKTLGFLGRYDASLDALAHAEALIADFLTLAIDRAIVRFNRALTLQEMDRHEESFVLFAECRRVFHTYRDTQLLVTCALAEGVLLQRLRQYREARETYLLIVASTQYIRKETLASLHRGIGICSIELGDFVGAEANLIRAIALNREIGQPVEALKGEALHGRLHLRQGEPKLALARLRAVRREFLRHALNEEAGICGLEIVEAFLLLDRAHDAEALARTIIKQFVAASLNNRAIAALGYLTEAIAARKATTALVENVRQYVISLRTSPERDFVPPRATGGELS